MSNAPSPAVQSALQVAEERGYHAVIVGDNALRIVGRFGDPTLGALEVMMGSQAPLGIQADGVDGGRSALCLWTGPDLYAITLGESGRWEHFRADQGLALVRDTWRGGARGRYRVPHGPLVRPLPEAVTLAESWGFATPQTRQPPTHRPVQRPAVTAHPASKVARRTDAGTRTGTRPRPVAPARAVAPEPAPKICPTCFMALPVTGRCDYCS